MRDPTFRKYRTVECYGEYIVIDKTYKPSLEEIDIASKIIAASIRETERELAWEMSQRHG